jgi:D-tyrosyl-tRNA(Tyr) deacylase
MRVLVQRVSKSKCYINNELYSEINKGYLLLVGFTNGDSLETIKKAAKKIVNLRIFEDEKQKMNLNIKQVSGSIMSISQFTLYANTDNGNRPSFIESLNPLEAEPLYKLFNHELGTSGIFTVTGVFGEHMDLDFVNDGPVTILLEF